LSALACTGFARDSSAVGNVPSVVGLDGEGGFGGPACDGRGVSSDYMVLMEGNVVNSVFLIFVSIYLHPVFSWSSRMILHSPMLVFSKLRCRLQVGLKIVD